MWIWKELGLSFFCILTCHCNPVKERERESVCVCVCVCVCVSCVCVKDRECFSLHNLDTLLTCYVHRCSFSVKWYGTPRLRPPEKSRRSGLKVRDSHWWGVHLQRNVKGKFSTQKSGLGMGMVYPQGGLSPGVRLCYYKFRFIIHLLRTTERNFDFDFSTTFDSS